MSKNVKKLTIILLSFVLSALLFVTGAMFIVSTSAAAKGNMQEYKEGKVKFEDRLWDESYYKVGTSNVIPVRDNATFTAKIQSTGSSLNANSYLTYGCDAYFIDGATYKGQTTKVFVYVGIPAGASASNKVPAVVCVHGGGGTAYSSWVKHWVDRGYAAIAMDTEGCIPKDTASGIGQVDTDGTTATHPYHHGPENAAFTDVQRNNAVENHWFYQAVSAVIASRTFIGSFDAVDDSRIAITGISYGSYLTSITCAYDYRYACAVPVYGSLEQQNTETYFGNNIRNNPYTAEVWDDGDTLADSPVPFYYLMGNMDNHFSVTSTTTMAKKQGERARMHIVNNFLHGHSPGAVNANCGAGQQAGDVSAYIDTICMNAVDYMTITQHPTRQLSQLHYELPAGLSLGSATLWYTNDLYLINNQLGINSEIYLDYTGQSLTTWQSVDISAYVSGNVINIPVQAGTKHYYVNLTDNYGRGISSHVVAVNGEGPSYFEKLILCDQNTNQGLDAFIDENKWWNDGNGWNFFPLDGNYYYVKENGGAYAEILGTSSGTNYGISQLGYNGGQSTLVLEPGIRISNIKDFPVHKPIEFYYNFTSADVYGQGWYTFSIFDSIEDTFTAQNLWHPALSGSKFVMAGANYNQDPNIDLFYNLRVHDGGRSGNNNATAPLVADENAINSSNWAAQLYKVRIEIGDSDTKVYVNDTLTQTMTSVTRASFRRGMAYMVLEVQGSKMQFTYREKEHGGYLMGNATGREFDYTKDGNGWSNYQQNTSQKWYDLSGNVVKTYTKVDQSAYFGSAKHEQVGNVTKYTFNKTSYVMNYKKFDVTKPITFYYNVSTVSDPDTVRGSWYNIGLFDTFERAFRTGADIWDGTNKSKVVLFGCTSNLDADGNNRSANYNKLVLSRGGFASQSTGELFSNYNTSSWDDQWVKVTINIGTDKTTITFQGATTTTLSGNNSLTQASFVNGYAYLGFSCQASCQVNFKMDDEPTKLYVNKVTGAEFRDSFDENGFSNYIQQGTSQTIVDWKGEAVGNSYGRESATNSSSGTFKGYSNLKLNKSGWLVNGNAWDVTKPIRLIYQAKTNNEPNNFYTFAFFDDINKAYLAGNQTWYTGTGFEFNMRATCHVNTQWETEGSLKYGKMKFTAGHGGAGTHVDSWSTNDNIYPEGYANGWNGPNGFVYVDVIIGTTKTAIVINGVTHYIKTTRSDFPTGYAYLSVANFADATIQMKVEQPESIQMNAALSLSSDIAVDFGVTLNKNYVEPKVEVEFRGEKVTLDLHKFNHRLGQYIFEYAWVTPQYLSDTITMRLMAKTVDSDEYKQVSAQTLTVRGYCQGLIEKYATTNTKLTTLVVDFLNYGAVCQQLVNNDVENLANKNIDAYQGYASKYENLPAPTDVYESGYTSTDVGFSGAYLELGYDATMAFKVAVKKTVDVNTLHVDFTLDGATATVAGENFELTDTKGDYNVYTVKLNGLSPTSFAKTVRASIKNSSDTEIAYCNYSVNTFIARKIASGSAVPYEIDLCKALYCLGVSATNYAG